MYIHVQAQSISIFEANFPSFPLPTPRSLTPSLTHPLTHLCLGIWPDPGQSSIPAVPGELLVHLVSQHDGQWHHLLRLISGIAIHETLCVWKGGGERGGGGGSCTMQSLHTHTYTHTLSTHSHTHSDTHIHTHSHTHSHTLTYTQ